jgi:hypothetical protein
MQAVPDIFEKLGGVEKVATGLRENPDTVLRWLYRKRIPGEHVVGVSSLLQAIGEDCDASDILKMNAPMKKRGWPEGKKRKKARRARS